MYDLGTWARDGNTQLLLLPHKSQRSYCGFRLEPTQPGWGLQSCSIHNKLFLVAPITYFPWACSSHYFVWTVKDWSLSFIQHLLQQQWFAFKQIEVNHVLRFHLWGFLSGNLPTWHCVVKVREVLCPQHASADGTALLLLHSPGWVAQNVLQRTQVNKIERSTWTQ